jgi:hypothetical protein
MTRLSILLCALVLTAAASAQTMQVQPIRSTAPAPQAAVQPIQVQPIQPVDAAQTDQAESAPAPIQTVESLTAANQKLRRDNKALRTENEALKARILAFTTPGGSEVRAFCPSDTVSRNTAGAENNCAAAGYTCDQVNGQCRNMCTTSDMCSAGFSCNPCNNRCETAANPTQC